MARYLWCEDSKSGYQFWKTIIGKIYPDIIVETKRGNTRLRKSVERIDNDGNQYYIVMDSAIDNPDVLRETRRLSADISGKGNVHSISIHSFEFVLLSFELLEEWVFAEVDPLRDNRRRVLAASNIFVSRIKDKGNANALKDFKDVFDEYKARNSEQIASKLLFEITRNTGFETNKSKLGECFVVNCCDRTTRQDDDVCGLDDNRINSIEKAKLIVEYSVLGETIEKVGL